MTIAKSILKTSIAFAIALTIMPLAWRVPAFAQEQTATPPPAPAAQAPEPLSADELEVLVARIALYPDELVALISAASLYPLQIVEAQRYLDAYAKDKNLKPKESWDGSVVSLLNYPEVVKMMSDDLEWTQAFGDALAYQQKDVLIAIQQLRDEAVAKNIIKTDDKVKVESSGDNIVIQSTNPEKVYVPRYEPAMLYEPNYVAQPISYYPEPYPSYWYPTATFFAAAATGAIWAAAVDWDDWGVWGGNWDAGDIDVDCNNCLNNINGKLNLKDVDWKNVDRSKLNFDRSQLNKFDRTNIKNRVQTNRANSIGNRASDIKRNRAANLPNRAERAKDVRKSTLEGLQNRPGGGDLARARGDIQRPAARPGTGGRDIARANVQRPGNVNRAAGKPKVAGKRDGRPNKPSGLGNVDRGKVARVQSNRGQKSMGGGQRGGGRAVQRGGGGGRNLHRGGGGGRSFSGGGGRRGGGGGGRGGGRRR